MIWPNGCPRCGGTLEPVINLHVHRCVRCGLSKTGLSLARADGAWEEDDGTVVIPASIPEDIQEFAWEHEGWLDLGGQG